MLSEALEQEAFDAGLSIVYYPLIGETEGMLIDKKIVLNSAIFGENTRNRITRHELEHAYTCPKNLIEATASIQQKYERMADRRTLFKLVPIESVVVLYQSGVRAVWDFAEMLEIDECYFCAALSAYHEIFGYHYKYCGYTIDFMPLKIECERERKREK